tara:strand:+ start:9582 stop:10739 length:1158 start_codon:yes stop_codon:yes gene_type:complete
MSENLVDMYDSYLQEEEIEVQNGQIIAKADSSINNYDPTGRKHFKEDALPHIDADPNLSSITGNLIGSSAGELLSSRNLSEISENYSQKEVDKATDIYNNALDALSTFEGDTNLDDEYKQLLLLESKVVDPERYEEYYNNLQPDKFGDQTASQTDMIYNPDFTERGLDTNTADGMPTSPWKDAGDLSLYEDYSNDPRVSEEAKQSYQEMLTNRSRLEEALSRSGVVLPEAFFEGTKKFGVGSYDKVPNYSTGKDVNLTLEEDLTAEGEKMGFWYNYGVPGTRDVFRPDSSIEVIEKLATKDPLIKELYNDYKSSLKNATDFTTDMYEVYESDVKKYEELITKFSSANRDSQSDNQTEDSKELSAWNEKIGNVEEAGMILLNMFEQ